MVSDSVLRFRSRQTDACFCNKKEAMRAGVNVCTTFILYCILVAAIIAVWSALVFVTSRISTPWTIIGTIGMSMFTLVTVINYCIGRITSRWFFGGCAFLYNCAYLLFLLLNVMSANDLDMYLYVYFSLVVTTLNSLVAVIFFHEIEVRPNQERLLQQEF